jgi:glycerol-3-phosphate dehydrogenase
VLSTENAMNREQMLERLEGMDAPWEILIIGGGATGLGCAVDAASRGYRTVLLEQSDFAKGTSSRSTKLIHGGVRYLQQGNVGLVLEALRERGLLTQNAPHLVRHLSFIVPNYTWWEAPFYGIGLKIYDLLAGRLGLGPSRHLSREETLAHIPTLESAGLRGGVIYYDGQFDDARLAVCLAQTAADSGAVLLNYMQVVSLVKRNGLVRGVIVRDLESGAEYEPRARVVVNATGVFTDRIRQLDEPGASEMISPSQGVHIVIERSFLPGDSAIMVPKTDDGRVLFAIPWHDRALLGTTDTPVSGPQLEPRPLPEEIDFLLTHAGRYLAKDPRREDVLSAFAGLRPLVKSIHGKDTASTPRDHYVLVSQSGLVTITGGKWTTYRKMAEDAVRHAAMVGELADRPGRTERLRLHGWQERRHAQPGIQFYYGSDLPELEQMAQKNPALQEPIHPRLPYRAAEFVWAARHEMARTVEDAMSRRTRALLLDAQASIDIAPKVAGLMAKELGRDGRWEQEQVAAYRKLAEGYLVQR